MTDNDDIRASSSIGNALYRATWTIAAVALFAISAGNLRAVYRLRWENSQMREAAEQTQPTLGFGVGPGTEVVSSQGQSGCGPVRERRREIFLISGECPDCATATEDWAALIGSIDWNPQDCLWIVNADSGSIPNGVRVAADQAGLPLRIVRVTDLVEFEATTGILAVPFVVATIDDRVTFVAMGAPGEDARETLQDAVRLDRVPLKAQYMIGAGAQSLSAFGSPLK